MYKILIANDCPLHQKILLAIFELYSTRYKVAGIAKNGHEAIYLCKQINPDLIIMDIHMPGLDGLQATKEIMETCPTRVLIVTATININIHYIFEAQEYGAMDVVKTPELVLDSNGSLTQGSVIKAGTELIRKIDILLSIPLKKTFVSTPSIKIKTVNTNSLQSVQKIIAIGASTGGPGILKEIISQIPSLPNTAIIIIQHIMKDFSDSFASWLSNYSSMPIELIKDRCSLSAKAYVCPGGERSLELQISNKLALVRTPSHLHNSPNIDILFSSIAKNFGKNSMGIILSGMGSDGAKGLLEMRQSGAITICQQPSTCVVDSMPLSAEKIGACKLTLTPQQIIREIIAWTGDHRGEI